jgi:hypothetical protein
MKKAFAVAVVATIAATTTEGANLRANPTKTLLARCRNGATVEKCCEQITGQHKLYQKKDDSNPGRLGKQCCSKSLGAWLPTNGDDADKFCALGRRTAHAEESMNQVKSLSDRMVNALNVLNSEKKTLKADYRAAYIAHEQTENNKQGENSKLNKELQLVEDKNTEKRVAIKGVNDEIDTEEKKIRNAGKLYLEKLKELDTKMSDIDSSFGVKQKHYAEITVKANDATKVLNTCKGDTKEENKLMKNFEEKLKNVRSNVDQKKKENKEAALEYGKISGECDKKKKEMEQQEKVAEKEIKDAKADYAKFKKQTATLKQAIDDAEAKLESIMTDAPSLLETGSKWGGDEDKETANKSNEGSSTSFNAGKYASGALTKKGNAWVDSEAKMVEDAQNFITNKMINMKDVLVNLKAVRLRVEALKKLDIDLNKEIMDDLNKKFSKLTSAILSANQAAGRLSKKLVSVSNTLEKTQQAYARTLKNFEKRMEVKKSQLTKKAQDLDDMTGLISDMHFSLHILVGKNKKCKAALNKASTLKELVATNLDKDRSELTSLKEQLEEKKQETVDLQKELVINELNHKSAMTEIKGNAVKWNKMASFEQKKHGSQMEQLSNTQEQIKIMQ